MKITCEHCGCVIDTDKDKKCPNCGAPYSKNKEYSEVKDVKKKHTDYDLREREADIHSKELQNEIVEKTLNSFGNAKKFSKAFIFIIVVIMIVGIAMFFLNFRKTTKVIEEQTNTNSNTEEQIDKLNDMFNNKNNNKGNPVTINYNENHSNDKYEIKCDGVSKYKLDYFEKKNTSNYTIYNFHIVFKNKTEDWKTLNNINLTYTDDKGNENVSAKLHTPNTTEAPTQLEFFAKEQVTYTGNMSYEIPNYVKDVKLKFENVTITIDDFKTHIK
ncbi:MAG: hypothetical protein IKR57_02260 [Bacilli bacterium]|nr:hypothetical protein [Bacilli bacterium]